MEQKDRGFNNVGPGDQPLGSADDVPDTRGLPAHGTEPEQPASGTARAQVGNAGGLGSTVWIVLAVVALVVLAIYGVAAVR